MRRLACAICAMDHLNQVLDLGYSPLADRLPAYVGQPEDRYRLDLLQCNNCGAVQLGELVEDSQVFGADYAFFTSGSPSLLEHYAEQAYWLLKTFPRECELGVVEIASNDGSLLRHFKAAGHPVLGIDPALPPAQAAIAAGVPTRIRAFTQAEVPEILEVGPGSHFGRQPGLVIANHVLAHVRDPLDFMRGIAALLHPQGLAVIEVQYFFDLYFGNEWDHVYHQHRTYLRLTDLCALAAESGLVVTEVDNSPAQGGSIRVQVRHRGHWSHRVEAMLERESQAGGLEGWQARVDYSRERIVDLVRGFRRQGKRVAGYGASAKSTTLLNACSLGPNDLGWVVDATPYKIGRFTPGTQIPITGPGERPDPDVYLLLVWNYLGGVLRRERVFRDRGGLFIVPIPHPIVL